MSRRPVDSGLQAERTLLAWRRTCLTLVVGCLVWLRVTAPAGGPVAVGIGLAAVALAAVTWALPGIRYRRWRSHPRGRPDGFRIGGVPFLALAAAAGSAGVLSLWTIAATSRSPWGG